MTKTNKDFLVFVAFCKWASESARGLAQSKTFR